jgi:hypothetical protein
LSLLGVLLTQIAIRAQQLLYVLVHSFVSFVSPSHLPSHSELVLLRSLRVPAPLFGPYIWTHCRVVGLFHLFLICLFCLSRLVCSSYELSAMHVHRPLSVSFLLSYLRSVSSDLSAESMRIWPHWTLGFHPYSSAHLESS